MKKLLLAVQVFGLIAAFPLYLIAELNHGSSASHLPVMPPGLPETQETQTSLSLTDTTMRFESQYLVFGITPILKTIN